MIQRFPITDRNVWLNWRREDVTASDVGAVCGVDKHRGAATVYAEKQGIVPPQDANKMMRQGIWAEPMIMRALADVRPELAVSRCGVYLRDPDLRLGATPDFIAHHPERGYGIIQGKTKERAIFNKEFRAADGKMAAPESYVFQTITEAMLARGDMDIQWAALAVIVFGWGADLHMIDVEIDERIWHRIRTTVSQFWHNSKLGISPPLDPELDADLVKKRWPVDDGNVVDLRHDNELPALIEDLLTSRLLERDTKKSRERVQAAIRMKLGKCTFGLGPEGRVISSKLIRRAGYSVEPTSFRDLQISKPGAVTPELIIEAEKGSQE